MYRPNHARAETALGLGLLAFAACSPAPPPLSDVLCNRDPDCASAMACVDGKCVEVVDPECTLHEQCATPAPCEETVGARCIAGRCRYPARVCDAPPASLCTTADGPFVSFPSLGVCDPDLDDCVYEPRTIPCPDCAAACLAACAGVTCTETAGGCRHSGVCVPGPPALCDYEVSADGLACSLPGDEPPLQSGACQAGVCTRCTTDEDCPGVAPTCDDPGATTTCQGTAGIGRCHAMQCSVEWAGNDSACFGAVRTCPNNLKPISCSAAATQPLASCPTTCTGNSDCLDGYACAGGACTCRIGDPCDDGQDCTYDDRCTASGSCAGTPVTDHNGCANDADPCNVEYFCRNQSTCGTRYAGPEVNCTLADICAVTPHCDGAGSCVSEPCTGGNVCYPSFGCLPAPTFTIPTSPINAQCADLGVAHGQTENDYLIKYVVTGPPGAHVVKYNRQQSCNSPTWAPAAETPASPTAPGAVQVGGAGSWTFLFGNAPVTNCEGGIYGQWESYVTVDGVASNHATSVGYNSRCDWPGARDLSTCAAASDFCSPCGIFGCSTPGQYCDVYSGGTPTCVYPRFETSPYCIDAGVDTRPPNPTTMVWYRIYGPEGARVHKYNLHSSCSGASWEEAPETAWPAQYVDGRGYYELVLGNAPPFDCATNTTWMGRWSQYANVGGDDTPQFPVYSTSGADSIYYNTQCSGWGFANCTEAGSYCY